MEDGLVDEAIDELDNVSARILQPCYVYQVVVLVEALELGEECLGLALGVTDGEAFRLVNELENIPFFLGSIRQLLLDLDLVQAVWTED